MTSLPLIEGHGQQTQPVDTMCPVWCATPDHVEGFHMTDRIVVVDGQAVQVTLIQHTNEPAEDAYLNIALVDAAGNPIAEPETLGTHLLKNAALSAVLAGVVAS